MPAATAFRRPPLVDPAYVSLSDAAVHAAGDVARRVDAALPRWKRLLFRYVLGLY